MLSIGLWRWYINITIKFWTLFIVLYFIQNSDSETGFCLRLQVKHTQLGPIDRASLCLRTPATTPVKFIKSTQHKPDSRYGNVNSHWWFINYRTLHITELRQSHWVTHSKGYCNCHTHKFFCVSIRFCLVAVDWQLKSQQKLKLRYHFTIRRAAWEAWSATWNLGKNSAFALGPRKTLIELATGHRTFRMQNWLLASSPALNQRALPLSLSMLLCFSLFSLHFSFFFNKFFLQLLLYAYNLDKHQTVYNTCGKNKRLCAGETELPVLVI
jgi:hypothetical protein